MSDRTEREELVRLDAETAKVLATLLDEIYQTIQRGRVWLTSHRAVAEYQASTIK